MGGFAGTRLAQPDDHLGFAIGEIGAANTAIPSTELAHLTDDFTLERTRIGFWLGERRTVSIARSEECVIRILSPALTKPCNNKSGNITASASEDTRSNERTFLFQSCLSAAANKRQVDLPRA